MFLLYFGLVSYWSLRCVNDEVSQCKYNVRATLECIAQGAKVVAFANTCQGVRDFVEASTTTRTMSRLRDFADVRCREGKGIDEPFEFFIFCTLEKKRMMADFISCTENAWKFLLGNDSIIAIVRYAMAISSVQIIAFVCPMGYLSHEI